MKLSFSFLTLGILGDIYLHYPRGSNNRTNDGYNGRRNGNRLFDSQNNNHGGYNVAEKTSEKNYEGLLSLSPSAGASSAPGKGSSVPTQHLD